MCITTSRIQTTLKAYAAGVFGKLCERDTVKLVFKDHPWDGYNIVSVNRWSLIAGSFMQKTSKWEIKSVVETDRKLLFIVSL